MVDQNTNQSGSSRGVLEILSAIGTAGTGIGAVGQFASGIVGGILQARQAEKAQAYQEKWANKMFENQLQQQDIQNRLASQQFGLSKAAQYFNQDMALRNEGRTKTADWHAYMQNAANKYSEILNKSRELRKANADALRNR